MQVILVEEFPCLMTVCIYDREVEVILQLILTFMTFTYWLGFFIFPFAPWNDKSYVCILITANS